MDEYIGFFPGGARRRLTGLRDLASGPAPTATEELRGATPASTKAIRCVFSGHQHPANVVFTPPTPQAHLLGWYGTGDGAVPLPDDQPLPATHLVRMVSYRIRKPHNGVVKER